LEIRLSLAPIQSEIPKKALWQKMRMMRKIMVVFVLQFLKFYKKLYVVDISLFVNLSAHTFVQNNLQPRKYEKFIPNLSFSLCSYYSAYWPFLFFYGA
jgi:hypothetical protein